jgi:hypothetical protein
MNRAQSGGGMPSMDEIMSDPTLRNMCVSLRPLTHAHDLNPISSAGRANSWGDLHVDFLVQL